MADLFAGSAWKNDQSTYALILTQSPIEIMRKETYRTARFTAKTIFSSNEVPHVEMPRYLSAADAAISFIKPCYSKLSSSPTKIAEYLASGVPIITNTGVGDVAEQIEDDDVGAVVKDFSLESYNDALLKVRNLLATSGIRERCRRSAKERFDLREIGGTRYRRFYEKIIANEI